MIFDDIDIKILKENFDEDLIKQIDSKNINNIFEYLRDSNIYYYKDLFLNSLDLFLLPCDSFISKFEKLKKELGSDYVNKLAEDSSLIETIYK